MNRIDLIYNYMYYLLPPDPDEPEEEEDDPDEPEDPDEEPPEYDDPDEYELLPEL